MNSVNDDGENHDELYVIMFVCMYVMTLMSEYNKHYHSLIQIHNCIIGLQYEKIILHQIIHDLAVLHIYD
ncbi:hypothetical protein DERP_006755 [Dermatophagoides pteronyssinus]|uniref:Uncharacterized protein n=1 Tax=Dermatophagoides pteronyssinus TaxID=6956 RepID=A0ABQ8IRX2_DERPT|nr:hypothetical protein DERP_006755 [Dermatophagoides pteronyssinus]